MQKQFEYKLANEAKANPKAVWKYINSKTKTRGGVSYLNVDPNDSNPQLTTTDEEKATTLSRFFSSVFTHEPDGEIPYIQPAMLSSAMGNLVIYEETVKQKLANLNVNKSVGLDGIHPRFLKELSEQLCIPLAILFNMSLHTGLLHTGALGRPEITGQSV